MKRFTELLSGSAAVLFQVAMTGWMFALSEINFDFEYMGLNYVLLSAVMLLAYYLNIVIMRRGVPVPVFAVVQLVFVAAGIFAFINAAELVPYTLRTVIINCIVYCLGFAVAAFLAWTPTNQNGILIRFDALALMIVVLLVLDHVLFIPGADGALGMCVFCLVVTLLASISLKSGALAGRGSAVQGNPALGRIMLFVVFGIIALLAVLVVIYAASGVKSFSEFLLNIITVCITAVKAVLIYLYGLFERFVLWLAQFMKDAPMEAVGAGETVTVGPEISEEVEGEMPGWIYYALGGIGLAALGFIIFKLRKLTAVKVRSHAAVITTVRRESGLKKALKELWLKIKTELSFRYNCLRYRRSAPGLLAWCEKKAAGELSRAVDESGERFLLRLGSVLGGESGEALAELAALVERSFYSPCPATVPTPLYKKVRKTEFKAKKTEA